MDVDEAGREYLSFGVDGLDGRLPSEITGAANTRDASVFDRDVGAKPGIAAAVDDAGVSDQEIVSRCSSAYGFADTSAKHTEQGQRAQGQHGRLEEIRLHFWAKDEIAKPGARND